jgi:signal recognition particle subunit SRP54
MQQLRNMGSIKKMMGMLPGAGQMKQQLDNFDEKEIVRTEAIIQSMTKAERTNPKLLNGSRRIRIAKGSGTTVTEVNQLVTRFEQAAKMMKTVAKGGVPNVPGMGPIPGAGFAGGRGKKQAQKKKGSRSGNPAKRAAENAILASGGKPGGASTPTGSGFGLGGGGAQAPAGGPSEEEMAALQKFLGR